MANRFLNNITINDSYTFPNADGTADQIIKTNGSGQLSFIDQSDVIAGEADKAKSVTIRVKNSTLSAMTKGQVICENVSISPPSGNLIEVALADNNGTNTMPALGILNEDLDASGGANDEGDAIMFGKVSGIDTSAFSVGDEVFVDDTAGGLTTTKPTGVKYIQKVGVVIRDDATNGTIEVFGAGRVNDVPTPLYIDHTNQRLGIGATSPGSKLHVSGAIQNDQFIIPNTAGSDGQVLAWPTTGTTLEWVDQSGSSGGIAGTIAAGQVAYGTATDTIGGEAAFTYNSSSNFLTTPNATVTGTLYVGYQIAHYGDTDTRIIFNTDQIDLYAGGYKMITCDEDGTDEVIINEDGVNINFRVESDAYTHMFFVDGELNRVGINQSVPAYTLDVNGNANIATTLTVIGNIAGQADIEGESLTINTGPSSITGELDKDGSKIINLADPTAAQDAATKAYVDSQSGGGGTTYSINAGAKSGSNIPINLDAASGTDSLINLTQGSGIVLTRNSSNQITIEASGGGGGSSTLSGLSDVSISSIQNNDLLMYNSTASEWQNTNLGLTVTPTLTGDSSGYVTLRYTLTVSNHATYDNPAYLVEVYNSSGTKVVANSAVTNNFDGTFVFSLPSTAGNYTIKVIAQDFGDLQSEIATKAITLSDISFNYRYFRMTKWTSTNTSSINLTDFRLYTGTGQSNTALPSNMTSTNLPTPFVSSSVGAFGGETGNYPSWKAFDSNASGTWFWNLSGNNTTNYVQIDLGTAYTIRSFFIRQRSTSYQFGGCTIQASNNGAFSGEEVEFVITGLTNLSENIG